MMETNRKAFPVFVHLNEQEQSYSLEKDNNAAIKSLTSNALDSRMCYSIMPPIGHELQLQTSTWTFPQLLALKVKIAH